MCKMFLVFYLKLLSTTTKKEQNIDIDHLSVINHYIITLITYLISTTSVHPKKKKRKSNQNSYSLVQHLMPKA